MCLHHYSSSGLAAMFSPCSCFNLHPPSPRLCCGRFVCDTPTELEELVENLHPQGVRESDLKSKLQVR